MIVNVTLEEAYARASAVLRRKMEYSVNLLRKAERLALAYDSRGGGVLPCFLRRQRLPGPAPYRPTGRCKV